MVVLSTEKPQKRPRGLRRDRDCIACKTRDTKCDLNRPACGPCLALGAACPGYEARIRWSAGSKQVQRGTVLSLSPAAKRQNKAADAAPAVDPNWCTHYEGYLEYFTQKFDEANRRRSGQHVSKLKMDLSGIWQLAWHRMLGDSSPPQDGSQEDKLASLHVSALRDLNQALMEKDILALFGIVTLSFVDVCEGPFVDCQKHLAGAKALLELHCDTQEKLEGHCVETPGFRQALSLLLWYDVMEAFLKTDCGLVFDDSYRRCMGDDFFAMVHCPRDTFDLYVTIVRARRGTHARRELNLLAMRQVLQSSNTQPTPAQHLQNAWRYSAAMASVGLETTREGLEDLETVELLADKLSDSIKSISPAMPQYRHLLCPVTVLRAESSSETHHQLAEEYWTTCETLSQPIYLNGRKGCDQYWKLVLN